MKKKAIVAGFLLTAFLFTACGNKTVSNDSISSVEETVLSSIGEENNSAVSDESTASEDSLTSTDIAENQTSENEPVKLTDVEIDYFTEYIQKMENYGFLLSTYSDPRDIDLMHLFYLGAGGNRDYTDEDMEEYLSLTEKEEVFADLIVLPKDYMENLLFEKTGYTYGEMHKYLRDWLFSSNTDCYYHEVGDTNYDPYQVLEGYRQGDIYVLKVENILTHQIGESDGYHVPYKELALEKTGDGYHFLSCRSLLDEGLILDYCYEMVLPSCGTCQFLVYEPDEASDDITMVTARDGEIVYFVYGPNYNNLLEGMTFDHIVDMGFSDYNNDGFVDIAMNINYKLDNGEDYYQLRVYRGDQNGYFVKEEDKAEECYGCVGLDTGVEDINASSMFSLLSYSYRDIEEDWISAYVGIFEVLDDDPDVTYDFLYIDNNDIPEILGEGSYEALGNKIYSTYEGQVYVLEMERLFFEYFYKEGLINNTDGISGYYFDRVYRLNKGRFSLVFDGSYGIDYEKEEESFEEATCDFLIGSQPVSKEEYKSKLKEAFPYDYPMYHSELSQTLTKDELLSLLKHEVKKLFD